MDSVSLVVSALLAALSTTRPTDTVKTVTKDLYDALKASLIKMAEKNEDVQDAIIKIEKHPGSKARQELLIKELSKLSLSDDEELLKLAQSLFDDVSKDLVDKKVITAIQSGQGIINGDGTGVVIQHFETRLAGDTSTDAPPPEVKKKKRKNK